jgi:hypothetical protein
MTAARPRHWRANAQGGRATRDARTAVAAVTLVASHIACLVAAVGEVGAANAAPQRERLVLPADAQRAVLALLGQVGFERRAADGAIIDQARIEVEPPPVRVLLLPPAESAPGDVRTTSFSVRVARDDAALAARSPADRAALTALAERAVAEIAANDRGGLYRVARVQAEAKPRFGPPDDRTQLLVATLAAWLALLLAVLGMWRAGLFARPARMLRLRLTHLLPAALQCLIFAYWGLYWRELVPRLLPMLALEVAFAVAVDLLFGLARHRRLELGVGALPIALSTNLFVVFPPGGAWLTLAAIVLALASKHWLRLPRGHLFNPSALGLSVVGVATMIAPALGVGDTAAEFSLMPNGTLLVLALAVVVQLRLGVALITIGAVFGLWLSSALLDKLIFDPAWAPVTLVITLLITDPATSPRDGLERIVFGFVAGVAMRLMGEAFIVAFDNDFYGKVSAVLLANLAVPHVAALRRALVRALGESAMARIDGALDRRWRLVHIAMLWLLVLGSSALRDGRAMRFEAYDTAFTAHVINRTPFFEPTDALAPDCAANPLFCREFSVVDEARCWLGAHSDITGERKNDRNCGTGAAGHDREIAARFRAGKVGANHPRADLRSP